MISKKTGYVTITQPLFRIMSYGLILAELWKIADKNGNSIVEITYTWKSGHRPWPKPIIVNVKELIEKYGVTNIQDGKDMPGIWLPDKDVGNYSTVEVKK